MLSSVFYKHGLFCAAHPWELIFAVLTLTLSMTSISFFGDSSRSKICGWNFACPKDEDVQSSDIIIFSIARCLAVAYIYLQFRKLSALGFNAVLGIVGLLNILLSVAFSAGFVHLLGYEIQGLADSLPFFLLLLDLSKVTALAKYALVISSKDVPAQETVARGVAILGPTLTLDTLVEILVIAIGCLSGIPLLEVICCFGCVSLVVNYMAFMTFFPGSLCLILELLCNNQPLGTSKTKKEDRESEPNPAAQRVKLIMCAGLALVHVFSRLSAEEPSALQLKDILVDAQQRRLVPTMPLWEFYLRDAMDFTPQQLITYAFVMILCLKYFLFDRKETQHLTAAKSGSSSELTSVSDVKSSSGSPQHAVQEMSFTKPRRFTVGNDDDEDLQISLPPRKRDCETQTNPDVVIAAPSKLLQVKSVATCLEILKGKAGIQALSDEDILALIKNKHVQSYKLEEELGDSVRGIRIRRMLVAESMSDLKSLWNLPYEGYDYSYVHGNCCENVIGYVPVPVGVAGPLLLNGVSYYVPLATTEGCLVASTNRGCRAVTLSGGALSMVHDDGMTRGPVVKFPSAKMAVEVKKWISKEGFAIVKEAFDSTSQYARLTSVQSSVAGRNLFLRFKATTGCAMGMNMMCKGTERALEKVNEYFPKMTIVALSGNFCIDKKPSALNWIQGRGKSVVCEATITAQVLRDVLRTTMPNLVELNTRKNLIGSAMAGSIGGNNAHAANVVTAIFIATGQDVAQTVVSSNCITLLEPEGEDLHISCTMPSIEVGTVGGGTNLPAQAACLKALGIQGSSLLRPGTNAETLASVICGAVLAAELSLLSALQAGHLVQSHLLHNRSKSDIPRGSVSPAHRPESLCLTAANVQCSSSNLGSPTP